MAFTEKYGTSGTENTNIAHRNSGSNQSGGSTKHAQIGRMYHCRPVAGRLYRIFLQHVRRARFQAVDE